MRGALMFTEASLMTPSFISGAAHTVYETRAPEDGGGYSSRGRFVPDYQGYPSDLGPPSVHLLTPVYIYRVCGGSTTCGRLWCRCLFVRLSGHAAARCI